MNFIPHNLYEQLELHFKVYVDIRFDGISEIKIILLTQTVRVTFKKNQMFVQFGELFSIVLWDDVISSIVLIFLLCFYFLSFDVRLWKL